MTGRSDDSGFRRWKSVLALALATAASAALLFGCSSDDDSDTTAKSPTGETGIVTGSAGCDQASLEKAVEDWGKANGGQQATLPAEPKSYRCADGWAVAFPNVGSGEGEVTVTAVFEAEGQFWIPKDRSQVCGKNAKQSDVPASLFKDACQTN